MKKSGRKYRILQNRRRQTHIENNRTMRIDQRVDAMNTWMCLHLFYIMILYLYAWMIGHGYADAALPACEALFDHLSWVIIVSEVVMLPVFLYWFYVVVRGKTTLPRWMAAGNVLVFYCILYVIKSILPDTAFRLGFTNGLMSESMIFFFILIWILGSKTAEK